MDGWIAYRSLDQTDAWWQAATIAAVIHNDGEKTRKALYEIHGGKYKPTFRKPGHFVPGVKPPRKTKITGRQIGAALRQAYGV